MRYKKNLENILSMFDEIPELQADKIINEIYNKLSKNFSTDSSVHNITNATVNCCKHCGSLHFLKNGVDRHRHTRYLCRDCNRTFSATTNSIVCGTHKQADVWKKYIRCLLDGYTIINAAKCCKIATTTAFYWRHKIFYALMSSSFSDSFNGLLEMDEMYIKISYKGNHKHSKTFVMPRAPFKRGSVTVLPAMQTKPVFCVLWNVIRAFREK